MKKRNIVLTLVCVLIIVFWVYAFVTYGDKPITEVPTWAVWLIFGK